MSTSASHPLLGRTLSGRYELVAVIGTGGMATVFRARDLRLGRTVAVKVLHPQYASDPGFVRRFEREAELAAGLSRYPHIVAIHDVGEDTGLDYIVMELVEGRNLKELIAAEAPLAALRALAIGEQVAAALQFAHDHGLVHRDVKPQNVLVTPNDEVKVTDFGIAREIEGTQVTRTGTVLGTAHYLSPEQALGNAAGPASDVYSVGVVLFEMLTGRLPFEAENAAGMAMQHAYAVPPSPARFNRSVPPAVAEIVLRAMDKDPAARYRSAAEVQLAMERAASTGTGGTTAFSPLSGERAATVIQEAAAPVAAKKRGPPYWLIAPLVVLIAAAAAYGVWLAHGTTSGHPHATVAPTTAPATSAPAPTSAPTARPSPVPTAVPSPVPSPLPTAPPTPAPTVPPTSAPVVPKVPVPQVPAVGPGNGSEKGHGNGHGPKP